jgi:hypothetical protein
LIRVDYFKSIKFDDHSVKWFELGNLPELILDHKQMIDYAQEKLREIAKTQPLGFELLPEFFTLPQLQNLYECIYDIKFDSRNFRKKILSSGFLDKSSKKDKSSSKKGAFLYSFSQKKTTSKRSITNTRDVFQF